jgi:hypothetical protein
MPVRYIALLDGDYYGEDATLRALLARMQAEPEVDPGRFGPVFVELSDGTQIEVPVAQWKHVRLYEGDRDSWLDSVPEHWELEE